MTHSSRMHKNDLDRICQRSNRNLEGAVQVRASAEMREAFWACEELIYALYRIGEVEPDRLDHFDMFTDDTVVEMRILASEAGFSIRGKDAVVSWYREATAERMRGIRDRLHIATNFIWRALPDREVQSRNILMYYQFLDGSDVDVPVSPVGPSIIADCLHRFRLVDGLWKMSYRYYWEIHNSLGSVTPRGVSAPAVDGNLPA